jgi:hypothetical protein
MKAKLVIILFATIMSAISTSNAHLFKTSNKLENEWAWSPSSGTVKHYIVEKYMFGKWVLLNDTIPADIQDDELVHWTHISTGAEIYKVRVTALNDIGKSEPSQESDWLLVFPDTHTE